MYSPSRRCTATIAASLAIFVLLSIATSEQVQAADVALLLDVQVNGHAIGRIGMFSLRGESLLARRSELIALGFKVPAAETAGGDDLVPLSDLPDLSWRLDQASQVLHVTVDNARLIPTQLQNGAKADTGGAIQSGIGATLNYDLSGTSAAGQIIGGGLFDLRMFSPWGVASSGFLARTDPNMASFTRLDTTYTYSDSDTLRRYRLGDFINGGLSWTRPVRLEGIQITSDFSMRPDLITFPLPTLTGSAAVPSTVDVFANGMRLFSGHSEAGPFEIPQLPVVSGGGTISMAVTDALGRQVVSQFPFYASSTLLAAGLQTFTAQAGALRLNWGVASNDYGGFVASGTFRRGLSSDVTAEASAEATAGSAVAGGGVVLNIANFAVANLAAAASTGSGRNGSQLSAGLQRIGTVLNFGISASIASRDFRDVAAVNGDFAPRLQIGASAGLSLGRFGSAGIAYTGIDRDAMAGAAQPGILAFDTSSQKTHIVSANYSVQFNDVSFYATGYRDLGADSTGVMIGLTIPLGTRSSADVSAGLDSNARFGQVQAQQSIQSIGDWGFQGYGSAGQADHLFGEAQYKSPWALLSAGVDRIGSDSSLRAQAQGAVSVVDHAVFASNTIDDSFAVVDTNGLANVHVRQENRDVGMTNAGGRLLVPDLRSFDINRIAIEPSDVPLDATIGVAAMEIRPQDRSGVVVTFPIAPSHGALLRLVDDDGQPIAVGSTATLLSSGVAAPVGYEGNAYIENLKSHNEVAVERMTGQRCNVVFDYRPAAAEIPSIGPLYCRKGTH